MTDKPVNNLIEEFEDELYLVNTELDKVCEHDIPDSERNRKLFLSSIRLLNQVKNQFILMETDGKIKEG